jgi:hypothetical protein
MGEATRPKPKITWILLEDDRKDRVAPQIAVRGVEIRRTKALKVALGPLPESWIGIPRLTQTGYKPVRDKNEWIDRAFNIRWNFCPGERRGTPADISTVLKFGTTPKMR